jgi:molybdopterin-guanine dinucleotide biosynthesis protein A
MTEADLTGFVLAGGRSLRMGRDKAQIPWGSGTMLSSAVVQMKQVTSHVFIVGALETENAPAPVLADTAPGLGPLAGIHAALTHSKTEWNLVLAVDLPLITADFLATIVKHCGGATVAVVPKVHGQLQPLCAAYHRAILPEVERALASGELSIHRLLERLSTRIIEEADLITGGFPPGMLLNVNTPEDLARAQAMQVGEKCRP